MSRGAGERSAARHGSCDDRASGGWSLPWTGGDAAPSCGAELITHQPTSGQPVYGGPDGIQLGGESWVWVRMPVEERDGDRYLCSLAAGVPACGVPHAEHTMCRGEDPDRPQCRPLQDPVVATPGVEPDDRPRLLLVRAGADGTTTQIRIPQQGE